MPVLILERWMLAALLIISTCTAGISAFSQKLDIGIFYSQKPKSLSITHGSGVYDFYDDSALIFTMKKEDVVHVEILNSQIQVKKNNTEHWLTNTLFIYERVENSDLSFQCLIPSVKKTRRYMNNFEISGTSNGTLCVINKVDIKNYLAGVIESEGGGGKHVEYYKVQAVLSRTYALDHLTKHGKDGFSLCDDVHCQAYHSMMRFTPTIKTAVDATDGIVMIDQHYNLADGYFFANCGGQTSESDFVWNVSLPWCKSVRDTFCIHSKQAVWSKKIPAEKWKSFLNKNFGYPVNDSLIGNAIYYFNQPVRYAFFLSPHFGIPLRDLREEFKLKSTWFSCHLEGTELVLQGKGFGHGVGLCQEGAMRMAQLGFSFEQILKFYFTGVDFFDYAQLSFFNQKIQSDYGL